MTAQAILSTLTSQASNAAVTYTEAAVTKLDERTAPTLKKSGMQRKPIGRGSPRAALSVQGERAPLKDEEGTLHKKLESP